jgi:tetratricopeptide (TPR) repeat protein
LAGSKITVAEIDPAVTETAVKVLGFLEAGSIRIHHLDARNYVDELLMRKEKGKPLLRFDFIYADTFNDISVPYHLTTYEFNQKIKDLLLPHGVYIINIVDTLRHGRFLGAILNTFQKTFPYIYVFSAQDPATIATHKHNTFSVIGSLQQIDFCGFLDSPYAGFKLNDEQLAIFKELSHGLVITDDYAPIDSLLRPVVQQRGMSRVYNKFINLGNDLFKKHNYKQAKQYYYKALQVNANWEEAYNNLGSLLALQGQLDEAAVHFQKALEINPRYAEAHFNLGNIFARKEKFDNAISHYQKAIKANPDFGQGMAYIGLGNIYVKKERLTEALSAYYKAIEINPRNFHLYNKIGDILARQGKLDRAIQYYNKALEINPNYKEAAQNLDSVIQEKTKSEK